MQCPDCNGSKIYESFNGVKEPCGKCKGTGEVGDPSETAVAAAPDDEDGVIRFSVTSDSMTGEGWIKRLESKGFRVSDYAKSVLRSPDFKPTDGDKIEIAVLKGELFEDDNRITENIRIEASRRGLITPNAEVTCLIREKFTDEDLEKMGLLYIVTMHEPIQYSAGNPRLLYANRYGDGRWLDAYFGQPDRRWDSACGFAFAEPQPKP